jgi:hypothetical protein
MFFVIKNQLYTVFIYFSKKSLYKKVLYNIYLIIINLNGERKIKNEKNLYYTYGRESS